MSSKAKRPKAKKNKGRAKSEPVKVTKNAAGYDTRRVRNYYLIPVVIGLGIVPLLVGAHTFDTTLAQYDWFPDSANTQTEFFAYYKMVFTVVTAVLAALFLLYRRSIDKEVFERDKKNRFLLACGAMVLVSGIFGGHALLAFTGSFEMFETVPCIIAEFFMCWFCIVSVKDDRHVDYLVNGTTVFTGLALAIGVSQTLGHNFFLNTGIGRLMLAAFNEEMADALSDTASMVYITMANSNNTSGFMALIIPITVAAVIFARKIPGKVVAGVFFCVEVFVCRGAHTDSILFSAAGAIVVIIALLIGRTRAGVKASAGFIGGMAAIGILAVIFVPSLNQKVTGVIATTDDTATEEAVQDVVSIYTGEDEFVLTMTDGSELHVTYTMDADSAITFTATDADGNPAGLLTDQDGNTYEDGTATLTQAYALSVTSEGYTRADDSLGQVTLTSDVFPDCCFYAFDDSSLGRMLNVHLDGKNWAFYLSSNYGCRYVNPIGNLVTVTEPTKNAHLFSEKIFSGRGYIWNRTIPLLPAHIILGSGADTFITQYPQDDYVFNTYHSSGWNFDNKAHCWYMNFWVENGLVALVLMLVFIGFYIVQSVRVYLKREITLQALRPAVENDTRDPGQVRVARMYVMGLGCFAAVVWYLINMLVNDAYPGIALMFWCILGVGIALNRELERKE
ncbi:MAG: O-antigen ligase family protein [Eubacterium sp.]|nr:O-antigen ligase family protein [Eubacterium sp.]